MVLVRADVGTGHDVHPDISYGQTLLVASSVMTALASITVGARVYVKIHMLQSFKEEDYAIILAMILSLTGYGMIISVVVCGAGRYTVYLSKDAIQAGLQLNFGIQIVLLWSVMLAKVSIGLLILRFATAKRYRWTLWTVILLTVVYTIVVFIALLTQCDPLTMVWNTSIQGQCHSPRTHLVFSYFNGVFSLVTNMLFSFLPIPMLWNIQIRTREKIAIMGVMSITLIAAAASAAKIQYLSPTAVTGGFLFDSAPLMIWIVAECNLGILAAAIPCLRHLFKKCLKFTKKSVHQIRPVGHNIEHHEGNTNYTEAGIAHGGKIFGPKVLAKISSTPSSTDNLRRDVGGFSQPKDLEDEDPRALYALAVRPA